MSMAEVAGISFTVFMAGIYIGGCIGFVIGFRAWKKGVDK